MNDYSNHKNLCSLMFNHVVIRAMQGGIGNCCKTESADISYDELDRLGPDIFNHNEEFVRRKKSIIDDDKLPTSCSSCINNKLNNHMNARNEWRVPSALNGRNLLSEDNLNFFEIYLSRACDLACVYCNPNYSTTWQKELGESLDDASKEYQTKMVSALIDYLKNKDWSKIGSRVVFNLLGGEPTYNVTILDTVKQIMAATPHDKISFNLITNLNTKPVLLDKWISLISTSLDVEWKISISVDDINDRCEAIRYGLDFNTLINNLEKISKLQSVQISICPTISVFNIVYLDEFFKFFNDLMEKFNCNWTYWVGVAYGGYSIAFLESDFSHHIDRAIGTLKMFDNVNHAATLSDLKRIRSMPGSRYNDTNTDLLRKKISVLFNRRSSTPYSKLFPHLEHYSE
jgi:organic radical activating enzyme